MSEEEFRSHTPTITIGIAIHKEYNVPKDGIYIPTHVDTEDHSDILTYAVQDNTDTNISSMKPYFSELTALYWLWENCDNDYKGLAHYRRYLTSSSIYERYSFPRKNQAITRKSLIHQLQNHHIILPSKRHYVMESIHSHYIHTLPSEQLNTARSALSALSPAIPPSLGSHHGKAQRPHVQHDGHGQGGLRRILRLAFPDSVRMRETPAPPPPKKKTVRHIQHALPWPHQRTAHGHLDTHQP